MITDIKVGQEVVIMDVYLDGPLAPKGIACGFPIQHNSRKSPEHPCRGKVLKVGRKLIHVDSIGAPWQLYPYVPNTEGRFAVPVEIAKVLYRQCFDRENEWRTQEFIDQCVESL